MNSDLIYRRCASDALMAALVGPLRPLVDWSSAEPGMRDLQLRQSPKGKESWASCYVGLTSVLDVFERGGRFQLRAHPTHRSAGDFRQEWSVWSSLDAFDVSAVLDYVAQAASAVEARWVNEEGGVQAVIANLVAPWSIVNREASLSFTSEGVRQDRSGVWREAVRTRLESVADAPGWLVQLAGKSRGLSPDFLAVDDAGRLLVVEAKPAGATVGITGGPAQVALYARMIREWIDQDPEAAVDELQRQLAQRVALGLSAPRPLATPLVVVPVLALGWGLTSPEAWDRLRIVSTTVHDADLVGVAPLEIARVSSTGAISPWDPTSTARPVMTAADWAASTYADRARAHAVEWKLSQPDLQEDGPYGPHFYPFCLAADKVARNLLPEAQGAIEFFASKRITWHRGTRGGPTTHLVSSQVQCVNALFALTELQIRQVFGGMLDIASVELTDGRLITFEYGGEQDHLGESPNGSRQRGAHSTSADAAFTFRNSNGSREIALIEWKYTEQYKGHQLSNKNAGVREKRYVDLWHEGQVFHTDVLSYEDMFFEPFYQLMRQQMLAHRMEQAGEAARVSVVHVSPAGNTAFQASLTAAHAAVGSTVKEVWGTLLKDPTRFHSLDSKIFRKMSASFEARYGHD